MLKQVVGNRTNSTQPHQGFLASRKMHAFLVRLKKNYKLKEKIIIRKISRVVR